MANQSKTVEETLQSFSLVILCGGQSSRLGTDKGLYAPIGQQSVIKRALSLLGGYFSEIILVLKDEEQKNLYREHLRNRGLDSVVFTLDSEEAHRHAALIGMHAGLKASTKENAIIMPVDAVGVRTPHLNTLAENHLDSRARVTAFENESNEELLPFPSAWKVAICEQGLRDLISSHSFGVQRAIHSLGPNLLHFAEFNDELKVNCNTKEEFANYFGSPLVDPFGRKLSYLRFSLTEACNLSCTYCLPDGFPEWKRHRAHLKEPEIKTLIKGFRRLGFNKIRFTGGEPTVHPKALNAIKFARQTGYEDIAMTTNAVLLGGLRKWRDAGLSSVNISLDTLRPDRFKELTKSDTFHKVIDAIEESIELGIKVKINAVLMKGENDDEAEDFIHWAINKPVVLRFIELMDTGLNQTFSGSKRVLGSDIDPILTELGFAQEKNPLKKIWAGPATNWEHSDYPGVVGFINPISSNFCSSCNRLRVQARGTLKMCLFGETDEQLDLSTPEALEKQIRTIITDKPERHYLEEGRTGNVQTFRTIGG